MNASQLQFNDPGNSVYLLYQKEVYNCDHSFLQSLMDWLYSSNESPFKFIVRNKAIIKINRYGIIIQKEPNAFNMNDDSNWTHIHFNLKHLKEIYVDKRHKDTCVLVSKVSQSSGSNYVWKKTNPSNYQSFRSPYGLNNAFKKSYLLTIIKFKDGPSKLLQTIQLLDSILADYNKQEDNPSTRNLNNNSNNNSMTKTNELQQTDSKNNNSNNNTIHVNKSANLNEEFCSYFNSITGKNAKNLKLRPNVQQYFNDQFIRNQHQKLNNGSNNQLNSCNSINNLTNLTNKNASENTLVLNQAASFNGNHHFQQQQQQPHCQNENNDLKLFQSYQDMGGHNSLRNKSQLIHQAKGNNNKRTLSIDNKQNVPLYCNYNNSSNKSLQNYQMNLAHGPGNYFSNANLSQYNQKTALNGNNNNINTFGSSTSVNFCNLSRQSSINEIRSNNHQVLIVNRNLVSGTGYLANNYHSQAYGNNNPNNNGSNNNYLDAAAAAAMINSSTSPLNENYYMKANPLSPYGFNINNNNNNTSNENLSEIGYQQYRKKFNTSNISVSSTSSLRNAIDLFSIKSPYLNNGNANTMGKIHKPIPYNPAMCKQQGDLNGSIHSINSGYVPLMSADVTTSKKQQQSKSSTKKQQQKKSGGGGGGGGGGDEVTLTNVQNGDVHKKSASGTLNKKDTSDLSETNENTCTLIEDVIKTKNGTKQSRATNNKQHHDGTHHTWHKSDVTNGDEVGVTAKKSDPDDNEENTVTIREEINYNKDVKRIKNESKLNFNLTHNEDENTTTTAATTTPPTQTQSNKNRIIESVVESSLKKLAPKLILDMLKSDHEVKHIMDQQHNNKPVDTSPNRNLNGFKTIESTEQTNGNSSFKSNAKKFLLEKGNEILNSASSKFYNPNHHNHHHHYQIGATNSDINALKESNKVREIINSFNNYEKNNSNTNNNINEMNNTTTTSTTNTSMSGSAQESAVASSKKKLLSKLNTINITNLRKPPPPVKKITTTTNGTAVSSTTNNNTARLVNSNNSDMKNSAQLDSSKCPELGGNMTASLSLQLNSSSFCLDNIKNAESANCVENGKPPIRKQTGAQKSAENAPSIKLNDLLMSTKSSSSSSDSNFISNEINLINSKLTKIVNLLNCDASNCVKMIKKPSSCSLDVSQPSDTNTAFSLTVSSANNETSGGGESTSAQPNVDQIIAQPATTTRKRTFANMIWPMDPEEERILRSSSPCEVPEVIVQRNDSVKSILKKNNFIQSSYNSSSTILCTTPTESLNGSNNTGNNPNNTTNTTNNTNSNTTTITTNNNNNKKRVDFHENCCFINFFEINDDEAVTISS